MSNEHIMNKRENSLTKRESNFELLRFVSIALIVFAHVAGQGVMSVSSVDPYVRWAEGSMINRLITAFCVGGGDTGVGVFFMITGYFLSGANKNRKLHPLVLQVVFYGMISSALLVLFRVLNIGIVSINTLATQFALPISGSVWWFVSAYILLCMTSPYINNVIEGLKKKWFVILILLLWGLWISAAKVLDVPYYSFVRAVWFYLVGCFIRKYVKACNKALCLVVFSISWIAYFISTYIVAYIIGNGLESYLMIANVFKLARSIAFGPLAAISLFLFFKNINLGVKEKINWLSSCVFGIYLLHESQGGRILFWDALFKVKGSVYDSVYFPVYSVFVVAVILLIGVILETGRKKFIEPQVLKVVNFFSKRIYADK